jgi:hypothetical protein
MVNWSRRMRCKSYKTISGCTLMSDGYTLTVSGGTLMSDSYTLMVSDYTLMSVGAP